MALTNLPTSLATAAAGSTRFITVRANSTNQILYTVPNGKIFNGYCVFANGNGWLRINDTDVVAISNNTSGGMQTMPLENVPAGTVFSNGGSFMTAFTLYGVES